MRVFSYKQLIYLCFRVVGAVDHKIEFNLLIEAFSSTICLGIKGSGCSLFNS